MADPTAPEMPPEPEAKGLPRWKLALFVVAGLLVVSGGLLWLLGGDPAPAPVEGPPGTASALIGNGGDPQATRGTGSPWAPGLMRMGLSFFVGFAIGSAFRSFFRLAMIFLGVLALFVVGLQEFDLITVHWDNFENLWSRFTARVESDFDEVRTAITGSLPQAGLASVGLFAGFKKG